MRIIETLFWRRYQRPAVRYTLMELERFLHPTPYRAATILSIITASAVRSTRDKIVNNMGREGRTPMSCALQILGDCLFAVTRAQNEIDDDLQEEFNDILHRINDASVCLGFISKDDSWRILRKYDDTVMGRDL